MSCRNMRWTARLLRQRLRELDCSFVRKSGSHEIWVMADGTTLPPFVAGHDNDVMHARTLKHFFAQKGIDLDDR